MIDDSKVTKNDANAPRILARQLARPLTDDEIDHIAGGMISRGGRGGVTATRLPIRARARAAPRTTATLIYLRPRRLIAPVGGDALT